MNSLDRAQRNELHYAAIEGSADQVQSLVTDGFSVDAQDIQGNTPLSLAVVNGNLATAAKLIELGANIETCNNFGNTPLLSAMGRPYRQDMISLLVAAGADIDRENNFGKSARMVAEMVVNFDLMPLLVPKPNS